MDYEVIKLNVSKDKIREYKQFEGLKLYSTIIKSQDERIKFENISNSRD